MNLRQSAAHPPLLYVAEQPILLAPVCLSVCLLDRPPVWLDGWLAGAGLLGLEDLEMERGGERSLPLRITTPSVGSSRERGRRLMRPSELQFQPPKVVCNYSRAETKKAGQDKRTNERAEESRNELERMEHG